jgi:hypothetical protein
MSKTKYVFCNVLHQLIDFSVCWRLFYSAVAAAVLRSLLVKLPWKVGESHRSDKPGFSLMANASTAHDKCSTNCGQRYRFLRLLHLSFFNGSLQLGQS